VRAVEVWEIWHSQFFIVIFGEAVVKGLAVSITLLKADIVGELS